MALADFELYANGDNLIGVVDFTPPTLEEMTASVTGNGVMGTHEAPIAGHMNNPQVSWTYRMDVGASQLNKNRYHNLDFRGAIQTVDLQTGELVFKSLRYEIRAIKSSRGGGTLTPAEIQSGVVTMNCIAVKKTYDGEVEIDWDIFQPRFTVDGVDQLSEINRILGR